MERYTGREGPVRPGMHSKIVLAHYDTTEQLILNNIAKEIYVTNGGSRIRY